MTDTIKPNMMDQPFPKSISVAKKLKQLQQTVRPGDTLGILIDADPDSMASALALRRLMWRKVSHVMIYHINRIKRTDNLAFTSLLKVEQEPIRYMKRASINRWALMDSQPQHRKEFGRVQFDIIIDHHPALPTSRAPFVDIREEYGATATIMTQYLRAARIVPSGRLATALFYGIKTDTDNFIRKCIPGDLNSFRYLHAFVNMNTIKKIESSEITKKTLSKFRFAIERLTFIDDIAYVHMERVDNPDILVILADFFLKLAEANWSIVSGVYDAKLVVVIRNATFRGNAGNVAQKLFGPWGGSAGGHASAARAEIPLSKIRGNMNDPCALADRVRRQLKLLL